MATTNAIWMAGAGPYVKPGLNAKQQLALRVLAKKYAYSAFAGTSLTVSSLINTVLGGSATGGSPLRGIASGMNADQVQGALIADLFQAANDSANFQQIPPATLSLKIAACGDLLLKSPAELAACEAYLDVLIAQSTPL